jgi:hypothetical protein
MKPKYAVNYSFETGAVDWTDMLLSYVQHIFKSVKWHKKLTLHIQNIALVSAHVLYLMQNEKGKSLLDFQMSVIRRLPGKHEEGRISSQCLTDHHFLAYVLSTAGQEFAMRKCCVSM